MTLLAETPGKTTVGPSDHGRGMTLDEFDTAVGAEGHVYELSRGVVLVSDVPNPRHGDTVDALRQELAVYRVNHSGVVHRLLSGSECKLLVQGTQSERHPDLAVYKTPPPGDDSSVWSIWVPEIVIEVVSQDSAHRDYAEKPEDYLLFGVLEYWIVDVGRGVITIHQRSRGRWQMRELRNADRYTTHLLPGFELVAATLLLPA